MSLLIFEKDSRYRQSLRLQNLPDCSTCGSSRSVRIAAQGENERTVVCMACGSVWQQKAVSSPHVEKR